MRDALAFCAGLHISLKGLASIHMFIHLQLQACIIRACVGCKCLPIIGALQLSLQCSDGTAYFSSSYYFQGTNHGRKLRCMKHRNCGLHSSELSWTVLFALKGYVMDESLRCDATKKDNKRAAPLNAADKEGLERISMYNPCVSHLPMFGFYGHIRPSMKVHT